MFRSILDLLQVFSEKIIKSFQFDYNCIVLVVLAQFFGHTFYNKNITNLVVCL